MVHIVIARHKEDLQWLFDALVKNTEWTVTVYNDGPVIKIPEELATRINVLEGDHLPQEATKYLRFIIDYYGKYTSERVIFLQADPLYHNPSILKVFDHLDKWDPVYQNLSLWGHPPPWGCAERIRSGEAPNITQFSQDAQVWHDDMGDDFQGKYWYDPWLSGVYDKQITVHYMCDLFGVKRPPTPKKTYAALFSTNWETIRHYPLSTWECMHDMVCKGLRGPLASMSVKHRACVMESMWSIIFEGTK